MASIVTISDIALNLCTKLHDPRQFCFTYW